MANDDAARYIYVPYSEAVKESETPKYSVDSSD